MKLWRKSAFCDGKLSVTISFVTNVIVTENCDRKSSVTILCGRKIVMTLSFTISVLRKLWRKVRHNFWRRNSTAEGSFCDVRHNFVTDWSLSVTNCDGMVRVYQNLWRKLWRTSLTIRFLRRNSVTNSTTMFWKTQPKMRCIWGIPAYVECELPKQL